MIKQPIGLYSATIILLLLTSIIGVGFEESSRSRTGTIIVEPGRSRIKVSDIGLTIEGWDSYGVTYFFLPSFADVTDLSYAESEYKLYTPDGRIWEDPKFNTVQDVIVSSENSEAVPYRVGLYQSDNLYTIFINTKESGLDSVSRENYIPVSITMVSPEGKTVFEEDDSLIKGRGNYSWEDFLKKSYEIKLREDASFAGMDESDKWCLLAQAMDRTKIYRKLVFDTSEAIGMEYSIEADWVDLYVDGVYEGNYLLCHEPDIGKNDLNIGNLEKENRIMDSDPTPFETANLKGFEYDKIPRDISGGYLIQLDNYPERRKNGFYLKDGTFFNLKSPGNASKEELQYISQYIQNIDNKIVANQMNNIHTIDYYSFARRYLIGEIFCEPDAAWGSYYFYKKRGSDLLYAGPCWDFDLRSIIEGVDISKSIYGESVALDWDKYLLINEDYKDYVEKTYYRNQNMIEAMISTRIDRYYDRVACSAEMDYGRWGYLEENIGVDSSYDPPKESLEILKSFLSKRMDAMEGVLGL